MISHQDTKVDIFAHTMDRTEPTPQHDASYSHTGMRTSVPNGARRNGVFRTLQVNASEVLTAHSNTCQKLSSKNI